MSILHAKLAAAKARAAQSQPETASSQALRPPTSQKPPLPHNDIPAAQNWPATRSRGRPRKLFPKYALDVPPLREWVEASLLPDSECCEFVGSASLVRHKTIKGEVITVRASYPRRTLRDDYLRFLKDRGHHVIVPKSFPGLIVKTCLEAGIPVTLSRAGDSRRLILRGVCLRDQTPWDGEDRGMGGRTDRKRWIKRSESDGP